MTFIRPTPPLYNLPSYYSECESYEEQLQWLLNQLQTLQADVDNLKKDTNDYTDAQIKKMFDLLSQRISNLTDYVSGEIDELKSYVDTENKKISAKVDNLKHYTDEKLANLKKYVDYLTNDYLHFYLLAEVGKDPLTQSHEPYIKLTLELKILEP